MSHYCPNCRSLCEDQLRYCPSCGAPQNQNVVPEQPMKWYKFIIYFQLFATAVLNGLNGILSLAGQTYDSRVYAYVTGLRLLDVVYGLGLLAVAVFSLSVRKQLKNFHRNGPDAYIKLLLVTGVLSVGYAVIANVLIMGSSLGAHYTADFSTVVTSAVYTVFWIVANQKYFNKRAHLFVNT